MITDIRNMLYDIQACTTGVMRFATAMITKLLSKSEEGRGGWNSPKSCSIADLKIALKEHVEKGDMVDIANYAMMIWNRQNPKG